MLDMLLEASFQPHVTLHTVPAAADFKYTVLPLVNFPDPGDQSVNLLPAGLCSTDQTVEACAASCDSNSGCVGFTHRVGNPPCCTLKKTTAMENAQPGTPSTNAYLGECTLWMCCTAMWSVFFPRPLVVSSSLQTGSCNRCSACFA